MDSGRKPRRQERRQQGRAEHKSGGKSQVGPLPISSHPEADPVERPLVTESDLKAYERDERRSPGIVSINGEDVDQRILKRPAA